METKDFSIDRGTDHVFRFHHIAPTTNALGAFSTWTTVVEIRSQRGSANTVLTLDAAISTEIDRADVLGVFDAVITANQTTALTGSTYYYAFLRTDDGFRDVLAKGKLTIETH